MRPQICGSSSGATPALSGTCIPLGRSSGAPPPPGRLYWDGDGPVGVGDNPVLRKDQRDGARRNAGGHHCVHLAEPHKARRQHDKVHRRRLAPPAPPPSPLPAPSAQPPAETARPVVPEHAIAHAGSRNHHQDNRCYPALPSGLSLLASARSLTQALFGKGGQQDESENCLAAAGSLASFGVNSKTARLRWRSRTGCTHSPVPGSSRGSRSRRDLLQRPSPSDFWTVWNVRPAQSTRKD